MTSKSEGSAPDSPPGRTRSIWGSLKKALRYCVWVWHQLMGDSAYENYLAKHQATHPDVAPMTEKEFWRWRDDFNEDNVQSGCC